MHLLKPIRVTLASNVDSNKNIINEEILGDAITGILNQKQVQDPETGEVKIFPMLMLGVVWIGRTLTPPVSFYNQEELFSLGLSEEFEISDDLNDDDYEDDEIDQ